MKKFEYKFLQVPKKRLMGSNVDIERLIEELNALGEKGWEPVITFDENQMQNGDKYTVIIVKKEKE